MDMIRRILASEPVVAQALLAIIATVVAHAIGLIELGAAELIGLLGIEAAATAGQRSTVTPAAKP